MKKRYVIILLCILCVIIIQIMFPFSSISLRKTVAFQPDQSTALEIDNMLTKFKENEHVGLTNSIVFLRTDLVIQPFEREWLFDPERRAISKHELFKLRTDLVNMKQVLFDIALSESIELGEKPYLQTIFELCETMEEVIDNLLSGTNTRFEIKRSISNLQGNMQFMLLMYTQFFEHYENRTT